MGSGVSLIVAGVAVGLVVVLGLRTRLPRLMVASALALAGASVGAGGLLVQARVTGLDWILTIAALGLALPLHVRLVFGRFGRGPGLGC